MKLGLRSVGSQEEILDDGSLAIPGRLRNPDRESKKYTHARARMHSIAVSHWVGQSLVGQVAPFLVCQQTEKGQRASTPLKRRLTRNFHTEKYSLESHHLTDELEPRRELHPVHRVPLHVDQPLLENNNPHTKICSFFSEFEAERHSVNWAS